MVCKPLYIVDKDHQRIVNPLLPPERSYPYRINRVGVPVNVPTRGYATGYQQVGVLIEQGTNITNQIVFSHAEGSRAYFFDGTNYTFLDIIGSETAFDKTKINNTE